MIVIVCEKPSVAREYASCLGITEKKDGYIEGHSSITGDTVITWTFGHLVELCMPDAYDINLKKWSLETLPFLPPKYKYAVINEAGVKKQFKVIKDLYHRQDLSAVYYAGDSGREGLYIQMLVRQEAGTKHGIEEKVVWIDSQTKEEILRGIKQAKPLTEYENLKQAAYMRAIEDYLVGINFSRVLSIRYGKTFNDAIAAAKYKSIAVGRVMTCVLALVVEREREIKAFRETSYYRIITNIAGSEPEWRAKEGSAFFESPLLYAENGFKDRADADRFVAGLQKSPTLTVEKLEIKEEKKGAPLLYNLAEAQFDFSKRYKISPDKTLEVIQSLYEKKLVTYPRTDARVLSSAVAKEISVNLRGLQAAGQFPKVIDWIFANSRDKAIEKSPYVNDSKITDHYAIIPTGQAPGNLDDLEKKVYEDIVRRFLSIFYPPCVFNKVEAVFKHASGERFYGSKKTVKSKGYTVLFPKDDDEEAVGEGANELAALKEGQVIDAEYSVKEGKTTPPKRYTSGSMVITMENAGKMIEDEELRAQIKGSGIGTSATRAAIIEKLVKNGYISLNQKTQILTPAHAGECVYDIVKDACASLLKPEMTASWEKGLSQIEDGSVRPEEYLQKIEGYIKKTVSSVKEGSQITLSAAKGATDLSELKCPVCKQGDVKEGQKGYFCSRYKEGCTFTIWKKVAGKILTKSQVEALVKEGKTGQIKGFKKKDGSTFNAALCLSADGKVEFFRKAAG